MRVMNFKIISQEYFTDTNDLIKISAVSKQVFLSEYLKDDDFEYPEEFEIPVIKAISLKKAVNIEVDLDFLCSYLAARCKDDSDKEFLYMQIQLKMKDFIDSINCDLEDKSVILTFNGTEYRQISNNIAYYYNIYGQEYIRISNDLYILTRGYLRS
jgi:hypothetical protein